DGGEAGVAGSLPVTLTPAGEVEDAGRAADTGASVFEVRVGDPKDAHGAGLDGLLVSVEPDDENAADTGAIEVTVDYSGFADVRGGDWASRLRLVALPECDVQDPDAECVTGGFELDSTNDVAASTVSAIVPSAQMGTLALTAGAAGSTGDWSATPLAASASWQVSEQTGDFAWSYPMRVPPVAGGLEPEVGLNYSSGSVDGRVASTNNQSSWVGDGWDLTSGYVERKYVVCAD